MAAPGGVVGPELLQVQTQATGSQDEVIASTTVEVVGAFTSCHQVVAVATLQHIIAGATVQGIVAGHPHEPVRGVRPIEDVVAHLRAGPGDQVATGVLQVRGATLRDDNPPVAHDGGAAVAHQVGLVADQCLPENSRVLHRKGPGVGLGGAASTGIRGTEVRAAGGHHLPVLQQAERHLRLAFFQGDHGAAGVDARTPDQCQELVLQAGQGQCDRVAGRGR